MSPSLSLFELNSFQLHTHFIFPPLSFFCVQVILVDSVKEGKEKSKPSVNSADSRAPGLSCGVSGRPPGQ